MQTFTGHRGTVLACAMYRSYLVTSGYDQSIRLWNIDTGQELYMIPTAHEHIIHSIDIYAVPSLLNCTCIITGSWDKTVRVWRLHDGKLLHTLTGHTNRVKCVRALLLTEAFDSNNSNTSGEFEKQTPPIVISGGDEGKICIWDISAGKLLYSLMGHRHFMISLLILPPRYCHTKISNKPYLLSHSLDGILRIWNIYDGKEEFPEPPSLPERKEISSISLKEIHIVHLRELKKTRYNIYSPAIEEENRIISEILFEAYSSNEEDNYRLIVLIGDLNGGIMLYDYLTWICICKIQQIPSSQSQPLLQQQQPPPQQQQQQQQSSHQLTPQKVVSLFAVVNLDIGLWKLHSDDTLSSPASGVSSVSSSFIIPSSSAQHGGGGGSGGGGGGGSTSLSHAAANNLLENASRSSSVRKLSKSNTEPLSSRKLSSESLLISALNNNEDTLSIISLLENGSLHCIHVNLRAQHPMLPVQQYAITINANRLLRAYYPNKLKSPSGSISVSSSVVSPTTAAAAAATMQQNNNHTTTSTASTSLALSSSFRVDIRNRSNDIPPSELKEYVYYNCLLQPEDDSHHSHQKEGGGTTAISPFEPIRRKLLLTGSEGLVITIPVQIFPKKSDYLPARSISLPSLNNILLQSNRNLLMRSDSNLSTIASTTNQKPPKRYTDEDEEEIGEEEDNEENDVEITSSERNHLYANYSDLFRNEPLEDDDLSLRVESKETEGGRSQEKKNIWATTVLENQFSFARVKLHSRARNNRQQKLAQVHPSASSPSNPRHSSLLHTAMLNANTLGTASSSDQRMAPGGIKISSPSNLSASFSFSYDSNDEESVSNQSHANTHHSNYNNNYNNGTNSNAGTSHNNSSNFSPTKLTRGKSKLRPLLN